MPAAALAMAVTPVSGVMAQASEQDTRSNEKDGDNTIIVTAQFREQNLQDTPISITAVTGEQIEQMGLVRMDDLQKTAPNVSLRRTNSFGGQSVQAFIRGVGQADADNVQEPGVAVFIDDVYHGTLFGSSFDLNDLERVEVLRGPQGTLAGRNAIGGSIRLITAKPRGTGEGWVQGTYGSFNRLDISAGFDTTIVPDTLFLRASGFSRTRDGYVDQIDFACDRPALAAPLAGNPPYPVTVQAGTGDNCKLGTLGGTDEQGGRLALRLIASPSVEINLNGDYSDNNSEASPSTLINVIPHPAFAGYNALFLIPQQGIPYDDRFVPDSPYESYVQFENQILLDPAYNVTGITALENSSTVRRWGVSGTVDIDVTDNIALKSITAYRTHKGATNSIQGNAPISTGYALNVFEHEMFSQELRLSGVALNDRLDWTIGGFYYDATSTLLGHNNIPVIGRVFSQNDPATVEDIAAFAQLTFRPIEDLSITGGIRYTDETKTYVFEHDFTVTPDEARYKVWTPRFSLDYKITPDVLVYGSYSRGFRAGGFNSRPFLPTDVVPYAPEFLDSFEVGFKSEWFDGNLVLNGALFLSKYDDLILTGQLPRPPLPFPFLGPINVGKADIRGGELELFATPTEGLTLNASLGIADYQYKRIDAPFIGCADSSVTVPAPGVNCQLAGPTLDSQPMGTPKTTLNGGIQYELLLDNAGTLTPRVDFSYQSEVFWTLENNPRSRTRPVTLVDASLRYENPNGDWAVTLAVTNLTDEFYYVTHSDLIDGLGFHEGQPSRPREWSLTVRRNF